MPYTTKEKIDIMVAFSIGQTVEFRLKKDQARWEILLHIREPAWDWRLYDYRIAEPRAVASDIPWNKAHEFTEYAIVDEHGACHFYGKLNTLIIPKRGDNLTRFDRPRCDVTA